MSAQPHTPAEPPRSMASTGSMGSMGAVGPVGPHLGERVTSFVDGTLAEDARDRALVHIGGCEACRNEVESSRLLKIRLSVLPAPQVSAALTARLLAMAEPGGPIPPRPGPLPGQPRAVNVPVRPAAGRPQGSRPAGRTNRESVRSPRRTVRLAALAGAALSTMVVTVVGLSGAVGTDTAPKPPVTQLTSNVGGVSDPMLDVSRILRKASSSAALVRTP